MPADGPILTGLRRNRFLGYGVAIAAVAAATAVRQVAAAVLPPGYPFLSFFPAVILTTFLAGVGPGILAGVLGGLIAWCLFIPPPWEMPLDASTALALGFYIVVVAVDIAIIHVMMTAQERLAAEQRRSADLARQTEVMFSELQHRVSNNLQLVSSLLMIQQSKVQDPEALRMLDEARARVSTLGRLHRALHNPTQQKLDMARYLDDLSRDLIEAAGVQVAWEISAETVPIANDKLVPVALIYAELFSNALEHGLADGAGKVSILLAQDGGNVRLAIRDDGPGLPPGFDLETQDSLGLRIVRSLAGQIGGQVAMFSDRGTVATLTFPP